MSTNKSEISSRAEIRKFQNCAMAVPRIRGLSEQQASNTQSRRFLRIRPPFVSHNPCLWLSGNFKESRPTNKAREFAHEATAGLTTLYGPSAISLLEEGHTRAGFRQQSRIPCRTSKSEEKGRTLEQTTVRSATMSQPCSQNMAIPRIDRRGLQRADRVTRCRRPSITGLLKRY